MLQPSNLPCVWSQEESLRPSVHMSSWPRYLVYCFTQTLASTFAVSLAAREEVLRPKATQLDSGSSCHCGCALVYDFDKVTFVFENIQVIGLRGFGAKAASKRLVNLDSFASGNHRSSFKHLLSA